MGARYSVTAPVKGYRGTVAGVNLVDGRYVGELGPSALAYFLEAGYQVDGEVEGPDPVDPPAGNASADVWRAYAVEHRGATAEQVAGKSRDELRDLYRPEAD